MAFSDFSFLFLLFPLALVLILPAPGFLRQPVLLAVSLLFFAWGSPEYVLLLLLLMTGEGREDRNLPLLTLALYLFL